MDKKAFTLVFDGYWLEQKIYLIPSEPGIYCVSGCVIFPHRKTLGINKLLYVGELENVGLRIRSHDQRQIWAEYLQNYRFGETLCYSFAPVQTAECDEILRKRIRSVLINANKPCFSDGTVEYSNALTHLVTKGHNALLQYSVVDYHDGLEVA